MPAPSVDKDAILFIDNISSIFMNKMMVNDAKAMRGLPPMPKTVSSSEAKSKFGEIVKWSAENKDEVIVKLYGEPTVVIMPYSEYEEVEKLRKREQRRKAWEALEKLRKEVQEKMPAISAEEAYRLAGFSEEVIQETLKADEELAKRS